MGTWKLEVAKMALYITFPVVLFHYFNQPEYFEEWVVNKKRELYPPEGTNKKKDFEEAIRRIKQKQELSLVSSLDQNEK